MPSAIIHADAADDDDASGDRRPPGVDWGTVLKIFDGDVAGSGAFGPVGPAVGSGPSGPLGPSSSSSSSGGGGEEEDGHIGDLVVVGEGRGGRVGALLALERALALVVALSMVAAASAGIWRTVAGGLDPTGGEGPERLLAISEDVVAACDAPDAREEGSRCHLLCDGRMCCFDEGEGSCVDDEERRCGLYGGCVALALAEEEERLRRIRERVSYACGDPDAGEGGSACRVLCWGKMCCVEEGARSCAKIEVDLCAAYAGCAALVDWEPRREQSE